MSRWRMPQAAKISSIALSIAGASAGLFGIAAENLPSAPGGGETFLAI